MHIQITDVLVDQETNLVMVEFSTAFGTGLGEWRDAVPERFSHHQVEIETASILTWGKDVESAPDDHFLIDYDIDNLVTLQGKLENIEDEEVAYLRLGTGLIRFKAMGKFAPPLDTFIRVHADKIILFPYDQA